MQIETFEVIGVDEQNGQLVNELVSEESLALIDSLGLSGQRELLAEHQAGGDTVVTRNPYREITGEERAIFGALLPRRVDLEKYADGPIPLRVLQVAAHAKDLFVDIEVWCPETRSDPDPLLIGHIGSQYSSTRKTFILARWGDVLVPLEQLRDKARDIVLARAKKEIAKAKATIAAFEDSLAEYVDAHIRTGENESVFVGASLAPR